jgi:hypothetical protein
MAHSPKMGLNRRQQTENHMNVLGCLIGSGAQGLTQEITQHSARPSGQHGVHSQQHGDNPQQPMRRVFGCSLVTRLPMLPLSSPLAIVAYDRAVMLGFF